MAGTDGTSTMMAAAERERQRKAREAAANAVEVVQPHVPAPPPAAPPPPIRDLTSAINRQHDLAERLGAEYGDLKPTAAPQLSRPGAAHVISPNVADPSKVTAATVGGARDVTGPSV